MLFASKTSIATLLIDGGRSIPSCVWQTRRRDQQVFFIPTSVGKEKVEEMERHQSSSVARSAPFQIHEEILSDMLRLEACFPHFGREEVLRMQHGDDRIQESRKQASRWAFHVAAYFHLQPQFIYTAMSILDQILSVAEMNNNDFKVLVFSSVYLACQKHMTKPVTLEDLMQMAGRPFHSDMIKAMNGLVLKNLRWDEDTHPPQMFLRYFAHYFPVSALEKQSLLQNSSHILNAAVSDFDFIGYKPSILALAALMHVSWDARVDQEDVFKWEFFIHEMTGVLIDSVAVIICASLLKVKVPLVASFDEEELDKREHHHTGPAQQQEMIQHAPKIVSCSGAEKTGYPEASRGQWSAAEMPIQQLASHFEGERMNTECSHTFSQNLTMEFNLELTSQTRRNDDEGSYKER
jgi:hypothetical protein